MRMPLSTDLIKVNLPFQLSGPTKRAFRFLRKRGQRRWGMSQCHTTNQICATPKLILVAVETQNMTFTSINVEPNMLKEPQHMEVNMLLTNYLAFYCINNYATSGSSHM